VVDIDTPGSDGQSAAEGVRSDLERGAEVVTEQEVVAGDKGVDSELRNEPRTGPAEAAGASAAAVETEPEPELTPAAGPGVRPEDPAVAGMTSDADGSEEAFGEDEALAEAVVAYESLGPEAAAMAWIRNYYTSERLAEIQAQHRAVMGHLADEERDE
jgi:hypothetical protein